MWLAEYYLDKLLRYKKFDTIVMIAKYLGTMVKELEELFYFKTNYFIRLPEDEEKRARESILIGEIYNKLIQLDPQAKLDNLLKSLIVEYVKHYSV